MKTNKSILAVMLITVALIIVGCTPEDPVNGAINGNQTTTAVPKVKTTEVFEISTVQAYGKGEVLSEGESAVIERGLCWSTSPMPTVNDSHVLDSLGSAVFICVMKDLLPKTTYYVRAYAINSEGVGYGNQVSFTTLQMPEPYTQAAFVGIWGVEQIDYYNTDYYGEPIPSTLVTYYFTPGDPDHGIDLVFWEDRTGEMRDRSRDTLFQNYDDFLGVYLDTIICPDTTLITGFSYAYHPEDSLLIMNMETQHPFTYQMFIFIFTDDSFVYVNEYQAGYVEKAYMRRLSYVPDKSRSTITTVPDRIFEKRPLLRR